MTTQNELSIILRMRDEASAAIRNVAQGFGDNIKKIGLAATGAGIAIEGLARSNQEMLADSRRMAASLNITEGEFNALARSTSNAGFALDEVIKTMEAGRQQGIRNTKQLQEFANFWDMVADATGESAPELSSASVALNAIGIAAGEEAKALEAFGFVAENTTSSIGEFLDFVERTGPELRSMGFDINDTAAILGVMEQELGMTGRTARQEFREAVNQAGGSTQELFRILGITEEQFRSYTQAVADSGGVIERNAAIEDQGITVRQKIQHQLGELKFQFAGYIETASQVAPIMIAMGPTIAAVSAAAGVLTTALSVLGGAMMFLALNPIVLIIAALAALVLAGVLIWKNWDTIKAKAIEIWGAIKDFFIGIWNTIVGIFKDNWEKILLIIFPAAGIAVLIAQNWGKIIGVVAVIWDAIKTIVKKVIDFIIDQINRVMDAVGKVKDAFGKLGDIAGGIFSKIPGFQHGGVMPKTGMAVVGERGPELVALPRGARVFSNQESQRMVGGPTFNITINASSGDAMEIRQQVERALRHFARQGNL